MANITAPQVNINGTGWQDLLDQHIAVVEHLTAAMNVLGQAAPHGRDFPVEGTYALARAQFKARHEALATLIRDYTRLAVAIGDQERRS
jgi:hypothetical protein